MSFELNQTAVSAVALLRAIEAGGWTTNAELATRAGRAPKNISRDLGILRNEGLIEPDAVILSDLGQAQLAAISRAENAAPALADDERLVTHGQMRPDPDNPRKDFESAEAQEKLDELRTSILEKGLLQNFVCRPDHSGEADYIVTDGNRRWHAIAQAVFDADWPEDRLLRIKVLDTDECESLITAVVANMQRADMSPLEEAEAFDKLINSHGLKTIDIANQTGLSQKVVQNRLKLLKLSEEDRDRMRLPEDHDDHLNYKAALKSLTVAREPATVEEDQQPHQPDGLNLSDRELLTLIEIGDKIARQPTGGAECYSTRCGHTYPDPTGALQGLKDKAGLLEMHRDGGYHLLMPDRTWDGLIDQGYLVEVKGAVSLRLGLLRQRVAGIGAEARLSQSGRYWTEWLNDTIAEGSAAPREPGSPAETPAGAEAPSLGKSLSDVEALILAEVTDACGRQHHPIHPSYAFCLSSALEAGVHHLVARELLAFRTVGDTTLVRTAQHSGGVKAWLESIGFYGDREAVLFELAVRVQGADNVVNRQQSGIRYATAWLNLTGDPRNAPAEPAPVRDRSQDAADALAYAMTAPEPEQPALIEETAEERAARLHAEYARREAAADEAALATFVEWMRDRMASHRADGLLSGWRSDGCAAVVKPEELAEQLVGQVAKGDAVGIAVHALMLGIRAGAMGAPRYLRSMPTPRMEQLMIEARAYRAPSADGAEEPDPEGDFVEAELDDAEAAIDPEDAATPRASAEPAVPIRKSITADHIVCLEDGRKFKSLKRHLRTKYNLSPEEYRAKWGLPRDYPMVAPNYAKARADLARQMGLS